MPRATHWSVGAGEWHEVQGLVQSNEVYGDSAKERGECLLELGFSPETIALKFDSGEQWDVNFGWMHGGGEVAKVSPQCGWAEVNFDAARDFEVLREVELHDVVEMISFDDVEHQCTIEKVAAVIQEIYNGLHPVGCERFSSTGAPSGGEWESIGGGWWRRVK